MIEVTILEDELTNFIGSKLDLEVDKTIFKGQIPVSKGIGPAVLITSKYHEGYGVVFNGYNFNFQVIAKYGTRLEAMAIYDKLQKLNDIYNQELDNYKILTLFQEGDILSPIAIDDEGTLKYMISYNGVISVVDNISKITNQ